MSDRGETEVYLAAELDSLQQAHAAGDQAAVTRRIEHVRAEAGPETAAVLEQMLKDQEAHRRPPTLPAFTPTSPPGGVRELPPRSRKLLIVFLVMVIAVLLLAVTVLVTVVILRPPATTTTAPPPPQATGRPAEATTPPPTSTATSTTNIPLFMPPSGQTWTQAWPQLKQITMPGGFGDYYGANFDTPRVVRDMFIADLSYQSGSLEINSNLVSTGPATLPAPEACSYAAQNQAVGKVKLVPGMTAWCIVTRRGSLVWLHLLSREDSPDPTLAFELMRWEKTS